MELGVRIVVIIAAALIIWKVWGKVPWLTLGKIVLTIALGLLILLSFISGSI